MRKFKCYFERYETKTVWIEVEAVDREAAEELAYEAANEVDYDDPKWETADHGAEELCETLELNEDGEWESDPCNIEFHTKRLNPEK